MGKKREFKILIRRDLFLLRQKYGRRFLAFILVTAAIDLLLVIGFKSDIFTEGIVGLTQKSYMENPLLLPYIWFYRQFGILVILYDFVSEDLFHYSGSYMVKIKNRGHFFLAKICAGGMAAVFLGVVFLMEVSIMQYLMKFRLGQDYDLISMGVIGKAALLQIFGMTMLFSLFALLTLIIREITAFLTVLIVTAAGLPLYSGAAIINHMMEIRADLAVSLLYCSALIVLAAWGGSRRIKIIDLLRREDQDGR